MDIDRFNPAPPQPERPPEPGKDPYAEPPMKDFSHLLNGQPVPAKKRHTGRNIVLVVLLVIILGGVGAYFLTQHPKAKAPAKSTTTAMTKKATTTNPATVPTTSYTSTNFGVTLNYPKTWTVTTDSSSSLTILSPKMNLTADTGKTVSGKIIFTIQPQGQVPASFGTTSSAAVLDSQLISYTNPSSDQLAQTYVSFVQYPTTTIVGGMDGIYITGNYGYQHAGAINRSDIATLNPLVTITFGQCATSACTGLNNLTITSTSWNNSAFSTPLLNMLKSMNFS